MVTAAKYHASLIRADELTIERALRTAYTDEPGRKGSRLRNEASRVLGGITEFALETEDERLRLRAGLERIAGEPSDRGLTPNFREFAREILRGGDVR